MSEEKKTLKDLKLDLDIYANAGIEVPKESYKTIKAATEWLEGAAVNHGVPYVLTEEDIAGDKFKDLVADGAEVGDTILVDVLADDEGIDEDEEKSEDEPVEEAKPEEKPVAKVTAKPEVKKANEVLFYQGKVVINVENKIQNGRLYKEISTGEANYLLTEAEFTSDVKAK